MVRDLETPGEGVHVSMWQDMSNLLVKVTVMAAGACDTAVLMSMACKHLFDSSAMGNRTGSMAVPAACSDTCILRHGHLGGSLRGQTPQVRILVML